MPRLIFKCPFIKGSSSSRGHLRNYVKYISTREGVEMVTVRDPYAPATTKQKKLISQLLRDFPDSRKLFEYEDYHSASTAANASELISRILEEQSYQLAPKEKYLAYIANRPHVEKRGAHGLFSSRQEAFVLSQVAEEVAQHPGVVWLPILSLRREDAARLGYDSAERWRSLLTASAAEMASAMKIPFNQFRWYAAFHNGVATRCRK